MKKLKLENDFIWMPKPDGWIKFSDNTYHNITVTSKGVYFDGVLLAKGKLVFIQSTIV